MPMYDRACTECEEKIIDSYEPMVCVEPIVCPQCGAATQRVIMPGRTHTVIGDDIPGGLEIKHGLCNEDGTPRKYYSHSEIRREAERRGYHNHVEHIPSRGSDKSPHTVRWV